MNRTILKQIWNERRSNAWLWAELLLVSVALWVIVDWGYVMWRTYRAPLGFDIENTYLIRVKALTLESELHVADNGKTAGEDLLALVDRLRHRPEVEVVSLSSNSFPYNGSNSWPSLRYDTVSIGGRLIRAVTPDFFRVFRYQNADGSGSQTLADALEENTIIVEENFVKNKSVQELLNMSFYINDDSVQAYRVSAVTKPVRYCDSQPAFSSYYFAALMTEAEIAQFSALGINYIEVCLRLKAGTPAGFDERLMKEVASNYVVGNCYIKSVTPFSKVRTEFMRDDTNDLKTRGYITLFLLVNIFLGIVGTFWFRTQQRRSEMGLRLALGSTRGSLRRLLITESLWILLFAFIPSIVICYNIGLAELSQVWQMKWGLARFLPSLLITFGLMALMIIIGIWYPARQAMKVEPAEALHEE